MGDCMFQLTLQGDSNNPLATESTFDTQLGKCAEVLSDYSVDDLRACTYGDEADELRAENLRTTSKIFSQLGMSSPGLVWASVGGVLVSDPSTESMGSRAAWQRKLVAQACASYRGPKLVPS